MDALADGRHDDATRLWVELHDLYARYATSLDECDFASWIQLFADDCLYIATSRENWTNGYPLALLRCEGRNGLRDRAEAIEKYLVYSPRTIRHTISNIAVASPAADIREVHATFVVYETLVGDLTSLLTTGVYIDEVQERGGELLFLTKRAIYDGDIVPNTLVYPL